MGDGVKVAVGASVGVLLLAENMGAEKDFVVNGELQLRLTNTITTKTSIFFLSMRSFLFAVFQLWVQVEQTLA